MRMRECISLPIARLPEPFPDRAAWVLMDADKILIGCGCGFTSFDEFGKGAGRQSFHKSYSILSIKDSSVIQRGEMNENRCFYGLVKIQHMYYAMLGSNSSSLDIFDYKTGSWELKSDLNYKLGQTSALEFQNKIYATGNWSDAIVCFDPQTLSHEIVFNSKCVGNKIIMLNSHLEIKASHKQGVSYRIKFDGDIWKEQVVRDETSIWLSQYRQGDYLLQGDCIYFISGLSEVLKMNRQSFFIEKVRNLSQY